MRAAPATHVGGPLIGPSRGTRSSAWQQPSSVSPKRSAPVSVHSQLQQQQRPLHVEVTPILHGGPSALSPDDDSRRRRRSRTPLQAPQSAMRHSSPHGPRSTSPVLSQIGRSTSPVVSSISRHASPHRLQQVLQPVVINPQIVAAPHAAPGQFLAPDHSQSQPTRSQQYQEVIGLEKASPINSEELEPGAIVRIGECTCRITDPLGMGSFGVVWAAECSGVGNVAVKEIICHSETDLSRAVYEAQLLWMLSTSKTEATAPQEENRVPAYVASDMSQIGPDVCRVRLAMGRVPGDPLDKFLREYRQSLDLELSKMYDDTQFAVEQMRQAAQACRFAHALVLQLSPTLERIAALAYHRDVNAHNILISVNETSNGRSDPQYGLVDFGLAVDATKWRGGATADVESQGDWRQFDVGGDCRYWPASAWRQFEVGYHGLKEDPALCLEYQSHLDFQGLGITALQVLVELLPPPASALHGERKTDKSVNKLVDTAALEELWKLCACWCDYWGTATTFWTALLDTFRHNGDWNALKKQFITLRVHNEVSMKLQAVRKALGSVEEACKRSPRGTGLQGAQALMTALLVLISSGEKRAHSTIWSEVWACLGGMKIISASSPRSPAGVVSSRDPLNKAESTPVANLVGQEGEMPQCLESPAISEERPQVGSRAVKKAEKPWLPPPSQNINVATDAPERAGGVDTDETHDLFARRTVEADESHDLFMRLSSLATKVVQLAKAMEKLELRDRDLAAAVDH